MVPPIFPLGHGIRLPALPEPDIHSTIRSWRNMAAINKKTPGHRIQMWTDMCGFLMVKSVGFGQFQLKATGREVERP